MQCASPILIPNKKYHVWGTKYQFQKEISAPCGYCCNCRANKRQMYEQLSQYQLKKCQGIGTFLTLTYDDYHLPYLERNFLKASLRHEDVTKFLRAVRNDLRKNYPNCNGTLHDFKYIYVGEYGEHAEKTPMLSGRPHYHLMLFGVSHALEKDLFMKHWKHGKQMASLPIKQGCARYVLKYLDKQVVFGKKAQEMYEDKGLERPRLRCSSGLVEPIINSQWDYIQTHNGQFIGASGKHDDIKQLSPYYKNKFLLSQNISEREIQQCELMRQSGFKHIDNGLSAPYGYSHSEIEVFNRERARQNERRISKELLDQGIPYDFKRFYDDPNDSYGCNLDDLIKQCFEDEIPF